jgi:hypothetical protein
MDVIEMGNDSVDWGRFIDVNKPGIAKASVSVMSVESSDNRLATRYEVEGVI